MQLHMPLEIVLHVNIAEAQIQHKYILGEIRMHKNLKIAINDQQPLDEVVRELKKYGYYLSNLFELKTTIAFVVTSVNGGIISVNNTDVGNYTNGKLTTLAELKEM